MPPTKQSELFEIRGRSEAGREAGKQARVWPGFSSSFGLVSSQPQGPRPGLLSCGVLAANKTGRQVWRRGGGGGAVMAGTQAQGQLCEDGDVGDTGHSLGSPGPATDLSPTPSTLAPLRPPPSFAATERAAAIRARRSLRLTLLEVLYSCF